MVSAYAFRSAVPFRAVLCVVEGRAGGHLFMLLHRLSRCLQHHLLKDIPFSIRLFLELWWKIKMNLLLASQFCSVDHVFVILSVPSSVGNFSFIILETGKCKPSDFIFLSQDCSGDSGFSTFPVRLFDRLTFCKKDLVFGLGPCPVCRSFWGQWAS